MPPSQPSSTRTPTNTPKNLADRVVQNGQESRPEQAAVVSPLASALVGVMSEHVAAAGSCEAVDFQRVILMTRRSSRSLVPRSKIKAERKTWTVHQVQFTRQLFWLLITQIAFFSSGQAGANFTKPNLSFLLQAPDLETDHRLVPCVSCDRQCEQSPIKRC